MLLQNLVSTLGGNDNGVALPVGIVDRSGIEIIAGVDSIERTHAWIETYGQVGLQCRVCCKSARDGGRRD